MHKLPQCYVSYVYKLVGCQANRSANGKKNGHVHSGSFAKWACSKRKYSVDKKILFVFAFVFAFAFASVGSALYTE